MKLRMHNISTCFEAFQVKSYITCFFSVAANENDDTGYMRLRCAMHKVHRIPQTHCMEEFCTALQNGAQKADKTWNENKKIRISADERAGWCILRESISRKRIYILSPDVQVLINFLCSSLCVCVTHRLLHPSLAAAPECRTANECWGVKEYLLSMGHFCYHASCLLLATDIPSGIFLSVFTSQPRFREWYTRLTWISINNYWETDVS